MEIEETYAMKLGTRRVVLEMIWPGHQSKWLLKPLGQTKNVPESFIGPYRTRQLAALTGPKIIMF